MFSNTQTEKPAGNGPVTTRRKESRAQLSIQLKLWRQPAGSEPTVIRTENLSRYGACLVTESPLEIGEVVTLTCLNNECDMRATVKHARQSGNEWKVGVEFVAFPKKWLIMQLAVSAMLDNNRNKPRRRKLR